MIRSLIRIPRIPPPSPSIPLLQHHHRCPKRNHPQPTPTSTVRPLTTRPRPPILAPSRTAPPTDEKAALDEFAKRNDIVLSDPSLLVSALTHPSFANAVDSEHARAAFLGEKVLAFQVTHHVQHSHAGLPADALDSVVQQLMGPHAIKTLAKRMGVPTVMRWQVNETNLGNADGQVTTSVIHALIGTIYQDQGASATEAFVRTHVLDRPVDLDLHRRFLRPKALLQAIVEGTGRTRPVSRMLKQVIDPPVFLVGLYVDERRIGDGFGRSREEAEAKAVTSALRKHYGADLQSAELPSGVDEADITFFPE
ncbi:hypothetical protein HKX48_000741 [Thoreauomyces humboldtii]|nr:hypothetical protein HKX48_000741 [Thoreauomyces humboldtii]